MRGDSENATASAATIATMRPNQRSRRAERNDNASQAERIGELRADVLEGVASARNRREEVIDAHCAAETAQDVPPLAEPPNPFDELHRGRRDSAARLELDSDGDVLALEDVACAQPARDPERAGREAQPEPR